MRNLNHTTTMDSPSISMKDVQSLVARKVKSLLGTQLGPFAAPSSSNKNGNDRKGQGRNGPSAGSSQRGRTRKGNKKRPLDSNTSEGPICYNCAEPGHYRGD